MINFIQEVEASVFSALIFVDFDDTSMTKRDHSGTIRDQRSTEKTVIAFNILSYILYTVQSCRWVGLTHGLGWVEIFQFLLGLVGFTISKVPTKHFFEELVFE